jgi:hypothetical protein
MFVVIMEMVMMMMDGWMEKQDKARRSSKTWLETG